MVYNHNVLTQDKKTLFPLKDRTVTQEVKKNLSHYNDLWPFKPEKTGTK